MVNIGIDEYYHKHNTKKSGNSYTTKSGEELIGLVAFNWVGRIPGAGEGENLGRKVLVPLSPKLYASTFFCPPRARYVEGMPVQAKIETRQAGEQPSMSTFVTMEDAIKYNALAKSTPKDIKVVLYSAEALSEGSWERTEFDWYILTLLCSDGVQEPMLPLTMARNQRVEDGGTKSEYSSEEYAEAIWFHSVEKMLKVRG